MTWQPSLIDQWTHDHWIAEGGQTLNDRLTARARELRSQPPAFEPEPSLVEALDRIVAEAGLA